MKIKISALILTILLIFIMPCLTACGREPKWIEIQDNRFVSINYGTAEWGTITGDFKVKYYEASDGTLHVQIHRQNGELFAVMLFPAPYILTIAMV